MIIDRVEGNEAFSSCSLLNGKIVFDRCSIPYEAERDLNFLVDVLRSGVPIPPLARAWLADIFDSNTTSVFKVVSAKGGRRKAGISHHWHVAQYAISRMECGDQADDPFARDARGDKWEQGVKAAMIKFDLKKTAVEKAIKSYRAALAINDEINRENQHD